MKCPKKTAMSSFRRVLSRIQTVLDTFTPQVIIRHGEKTHRQICAIVIYFRIIFRPFLGNPSILFYLFINMHVIFNPEEYAEWITMIRYTNNEKSSLKQVSGTARATKREKEVPINIRRATKEQRCRLRKQMESLSGCFVRVHICFFLLEDLVLTRSLAREDDVLTSL